MKLAIHELLPPPYYNMYMVGQHHVDSEDPFTRMSRLLTQELYFKKNIPAQEVIEKIEQVDLYKELGQES